MGCALKRLILWVFFLVPIFSMYAQDNFTSLLIEKMKAYNTEYPREKAYLQLDKYYYVGGESLWLKAYIVEAASLKPTYISSVLHVDLIGPRDTLITEVLFPIEGGEVIGEITLPRSLKRGVYRIRAYTNWMRNFDMDFQTSFRLLNGDALAPLPPREEGDRPDIQFLPEGGKLIAGIEQEVAFKAVGPDGLGIPIEGAIVNRRGDTLKLFTASYKGMGKFLLTAEKNGWYQARVRHQGEDYVYDLPMPEDEGFVLSVNPGYFVTDVSIKTNVNRRLPGYYLIASHEGEILFAMKGKIAEGERLISIPNVNFPTGALQITLFDQFQIPQAERLVFVQRKDALQLDLKQSKSRFGKREKVELDIQVNDATGKAVPDGIFSLAVVDETALWDEQPDKSSIMSHFWLGSDIKAYLETPAFYFENESEALYQALDLVMLTHGWRKYDWKKMSKGDYPIAPYLIERGITFSGRVIHEFGRPMKNGQLNLMVNDLTNFYSTSTDEFGQFIFGGVNSNDTSKLFLQVLNRKNKQRYVKLTLDKPPLYPYLAYPFRYMNLDPTNLPAETMELLEQSDQQLKVLDFVDGTAQYDLDEVEIEGRQSSEEENSDPFKLYSRADFTLDGEELADNTNVFEAIRGRIPGVTVRGGYGSYTVNIRGVNSLSGSADPLFLLDGIPGDVDMLLSVPMANVASVEVLKGPSAAIFGSRGSNGVLAVYTKKGAAPSEADEQMRGIFRPEIRGFHLSKEFYKPDYEKGAEREDLPDLRTTVHWEPLIKTDKNGRAKLSFFHSDVSGRFRIILEGMSQDGKLGRTEAIYDVEK